VNDERRTIASVRRSDLARIADFALATDRPVEELATIIARALGWDGRFEVFADPPGRLLQSRETLADAGVWDGAAMVMHTPGAAESVASSSAEPGLDYVWRRIDSG
jgi:hypothetical protein